MDKVQSRRLLPLAAAWVFWLLLGAAALLALLLLVNDNALGLALLALAGLGFIAWGGFLYRRALIQAEQRIDRLKAQRPRLEDLRTLDNTWESLLTASSLDQLWAAIYTCVTLLLGDPPPLFYIAVPDLAPSVYHFPLVLRDGAALDWPPGQAAGSPLDWIMETRRSLLLRGGDSVLPGGSAETPRPDALAAPCMAFLGVPVLHSGQVLAIIALQHPADPHAWDGTVQPTLVGAAAQAAPALRNLLLLTEAQRLADDLLLINSVASVINFNPELDQVLRAICQVALDVGAARGSAIFLKAGDSLTLRLMDNGGLDLASRFTLLDLTLLPGGEDSLRQVRVFERGAALPEPFAALLDAFSLAVVLTVPLVARHTLTGLLLLCYEAPHHSSASELSLLDTLANQAAVALQNARLFQETQAAVDRLSYIAEGSRHFTSSLHLDVVTKAVLDWLVAGLKVDAAAIYLWNLDNRLLERQAQRPGTNGGADAQALPDPPFAAAYAPDDLPELRVSFQHGWPRITVWGEAGLSAPLEALLAELGYTTLAIVPLVQRESPLGVLLLGLAGEREFSPRDMDLAEAIANHAASAIQNAQLYNLTETALSDRLTEISAIEHILQRLSAAIDLRAVIEAVLRSAHDVTRAERLDFILLDDLGGATALWWQEGVDGLETGSVSSLDDLGVLSRVLRDQQPALLTDTARDPLYVSPGDGNLYRTELAVPIVLEGRTLGALNLESRPTYAFNDAHLRFSQTLAQHAAIAIERARLFERYRHQVETLGVLHNLSLRLLTTPQLQALLDAACAAALQIIGGETARFYFYDAEEDRLTFAASLWFDGRQNVEVTPPRPQGNTYHAARSGEYHISDDIPEQPGLHTTQEIALPVKQGERVVGVLNTGTADPQGVDQSDVQALLLLGNQIAVALHMLALFDAVRTEHDRMQTILDTVRDGLVLLDNEGHLNAANPAAMRIAGFDLLPYIGSDFIRLVRAIARQGRPGLRYSLDDVRSIVHQVEADPYAVTRRDGLEIEIDGEMYYFIEQSVPVKGEPGQPAGRLFVFSDITEIRRLEKNRLELTNMIVHDLKNPLNTVKMAMSMMESFGYDPLNPADVQQMQLASGSSDTLEVMIQSILDVAKMESGQLNMQRHSAALGPIVDQVLFRQQIIAQHVNILLLSEIPPDLPPVWVDVELIGRVFTNLVSNAIRFSPEGEAVLVTAEYLPDTAQVMCGVLDRGPGVPPDLRDQLFERFQSGLVVGEKRKDRSSGTGLGLPFCKRTVEEHGGDIWVDDAPGGGAAFRFTLPAVRETSMMQPEETA